MKKIILLSMLLAAGCCFTAWARDPGTVDISGKDIKETGLLRDGKIYTAPQLLEAGKQWKMDLAADGLYVRLTPPGTTTEWKVQIPEEVIDGNRYVDFSLFAPRAGVAYEYNEKKGKLKLLDPGKAKKEKEKKKKKQEKAEPAAVKQPVLLVWDPEESFDPTGAFFPADMGERIISPTWGSYSDVIEDNLYRHYDYIAAAQGEGVDVMPLIHNDFDIPATAKFMRDKKSQETFISKVAAVSEVWGLRGVNIDFENMAQEDSGLFTEFIRKLAEPLHKEGKQVSVDVTEYNEGSPTWSLCYDRKALAPYVDYEVLMGYDETPQGSRYAGSVASYGWLARAVKRMREDVPADKLILGLPWYTRVWTGNPGWASADVLTTRYTGNFIRRRRLHPAWDSSARQYHARWPEYGTTREVWFEDRKSLSEKMNLGKEYGLAGYAFWRYGFEPVELYGQLAHDYTQEEKDLEKYPNLARVLGKK